MPKDLVTIPVIRKRFAVKSIKIHAWNELLRELAAAGYHFFQTEGKVLHQSGKIYCKIIKSQGGIAIDIWSLIDAWLGIASRPAVCKSRFPGHWVPNKVPEPFLLNQANIRRIMAKVWFRRNEFCCSFPSALFGTTRFIAFIQPIRQPEQFEFAHSQIRKLADDLSVLQIRFPF